MIEEKKQEQVVEEVVTEEYVEAPHKWTFLKYVKSIAHFKWWVIGFTLFAGLAGFLGFRFLLNPMKKTLSTTYTYNLAGEYIDSDTFRFIDGTLFNPYDLTSKENLQKVKSSDNKYANVNIDNIVSDNAIVVEKIVTYYNENDNDSVSVNYFIQAKAKYFPTDDLGKDFLYDLINLSKGLSTVAINNYKANLSFAENFSSLTFDRQINQLEEQYETIEGLYESLIKSFGNTADGNTDGKKLYELFNSYVSQYYVSGVSSFTNILTGQKDAKKYVNYTIGQEEAKIEEIHNLCQSYIETIKNNTKTITIYEDHLNKLLNSPSIIGTDTNVSAQITRYNDLIANLKINNADMDNELNNNGYYLNNLGEYVFDPLDDNTTIYKLTAKEAAWVNENAAFAEIIKEYKDSLTANNDKITKIYQYCYSQYQNKVTIQNGGYINLNGSISSALGIIAGMAAGFLLTSLVTATIYVYKHE